MFHMRPFLKGECEGRKTELGKTETESEQMIQESQLKIQELRHSAKLSMEAADKETADGVEVYTVLTHIVEKGLAELTEQINQKQETTEKQAEDFVKELDQEISELMRRNAEMKQLSHSDDHFLLLQSLSSLNVSLTTKDWTKVHL